MGLGKKIFKIKLFVGIVNSNYLQNLCYEKILLTIYFEYIGVLYYETLRLHNLRKMDRFHCKLVTFGLDKYKLA